MSITLMMIFMSIMSMCWWRKNIIIMLLSLELLLISIYFYLSSSLLTMSMSSLMIMLIMMVSGSSVGLSLLISMSHSHNSTNSIFMNLLTSDKNYITLNLFNIIHKQHFNNYNISILHNNHNSIYL